MKPLSETPPLRDPPATVHDAAVSTLWRVAIIGRAEPLLLPRILQKLAVPDIELLEVCYAVESATGRARCELCIHTTAARVELTAAKLRKIVTVERVEIARM